MYVLLVCLILLQCQPFWKVTQPIASEAEAKGRNYEANNIKGTEDRGNNNLHYFDTHKSVGLNTATHRVPGLTTHDRHYGRIRSCIISTTTAATTKS